MTTGQEVAVRREDHQMDQATLLKVIAGGDCAGLSEAQKVQYYRSRCDAAGLDYRAQPFQFMTLNNKLTLYALKAASDQLAAKHGVVVEIVDQRTEGNMRTVTVRARAKDGRQTDEIGCVNVGGLAGDQLGNAYMKAVTKAKRRAILSICGLGMMDETEVESVKDATVITPPAAVRKSEQRTQEPPKPPPPTQPTIDEINDKLAEQAQEPIVIPDTQPPQIEVKEDGTIEGLFFIKDVKYAESPPGAKKLWKKWAAVIDYEGKEITPSTFDTEMGAILNDLKGKDAWMSFKYDGKYWTLNGAFPPKF